MSWRQAPSAPRTPANRSTREEMRRRATARLLISTPAPDAAGRPSRRALPFRRPTFLADLKNMRGPAQAALFAIAAAALAAASPALRAADAVDLELILAVDVSRSMDSEEQRVQRSGYVSAFRNPEILQAIRSGPYGRIAITYMEWSSSYYQQTLVPWTIIATNDDINRFANALAAAPITTDSR